MKHYKVLGDYTRQGYVEMQQLLELVLIKSSVKFNVNVALDIVPNTGGKIRASMDGDADCMESAVEYVNETISERFPCFKLLEE